MTPRPDPVHRRVSLNSLGLPCRGPEEVPGHFRPAFRWQAEKDRGLLHDPEYAARMEILLVEFHEWFETYAMFVRYAEEPT